MRLFQNNCFHTLYEKSNKKLLATFAELFAHSSLSAEGQRKSNKSYQWNFLKVVVLKCSTKGAMNSFFRRELVGSLLSAESQRKCNAYPSFSQSTLYLTFYQQKIDKNAMLRNFVSITGKMYQCDFPKVAVSKRSTTGAMSSSFRRAPCTKPSIRRISAKIQCFGILFQVLAKLICETFPKQLFKALYERSNEQVLS